MLRPTPGLTLLTTLQEESLGSEMITSGNFSSPSPWTLAAKWSISGGKLVHIAGAADTASQVAGSMVAAPVAGSTYRVTFTVESISAGLFTVTLGGATYASPIIASGSYSFEITATDTTGLILTATASLAVSLDSMSVKTLTYPQYAIRGMLPVGDYLYVVYGPYLRRLDSAFSSTTLNSDWLMNSTGLVTMAHIRSGDGFQIMICDGTDKSAYIYDTDTELFTVLNELDYDFQGGGSVAALDGYFLSHQVDGDRIYNSEVSEGLSWDAADDSRAWVKTSDIQRIYAHDQLLWIFKQDGAEVFYNSGEAGDTQPTFQRMSGGAINIGTIASWSVASIKDKLFWLGSDKTVQMATGQSLRTVSTPQLSYQIEAMATVSDAVGYGYTEEGHDFYVLSFPSTDVTYVYDSSMDEWHERESYDSDRQTDGRHRSNCYAYFQDRHVVGDFANTKLYELDTTVRTEDGNRIIRQRITQNINQDNLMLFLNRFEVHFEGGIGLANGQGSSPLAMLRVSKDGGHVWSGVRTAPMGGKGNYDTRSYWAQLGSGRDFAVWLSVSDPVKAIVIGAYLDYEQGYA
ncbi:MAG: hypothetical protein C4542_08170 [Dehalococcoidia bacterium]|nr:MAG: hypothetical protein C4542_08170 [Dehalococcoidia bacterium]